VQQEHRQHSLLCLQKPLILLNTCCVGMMGYIAHSHPAAQAAPSALCQNHKDLHPSFTSAAAKHAEVGRSAALNSTAQYIQLESMVA
jgi:hypothetical protein